MTTARASITLPPGVTPIGLTREQAAVYVGVGPTTFDKAVAAGELPAPRTIQHRKIWYRGDLDAALSGEAVKPVDVPGGGWRHLENAREAGPRR